MRYSFVSTTLHGCQSFWSLPNPPLHHFEAYCLRALVSFHSRFLFNAQVQGHVFSSLLHTLKTHKGDSVVTIAFAHTGVQVCNFFYMCVWQSIAFFTIKHYLELWNCFFVIIHNLYMIPKNIKKYQCSHINKLDL